MRVLTINVSGPGPSDCSDACRTHARTHAQLEALQASQYRVGDQADSRYFVLVRPGFGGPREVFQENLENSAFSLCPCGQYTAMPRGDKNVLILCAGIPCSGVWQSTLQDSFPSYFYARVIAVDVGFASLSLSLSLSLVPLKNVWGTSLKTFI